MSAVARRRIEISGVVQAVGFRPYVHALATALGLAGEVRNVDGTVRIDVQGPEPVMDRFETRLRVDPPSLARIDRIVTEHLAPVYGDPGLGDPVFGEEGQFRIRDSLRHRAEVRRAGTLPPDTAPCPACLAEMDDPRDRRYRHAFIACTQCGPRFTIAEQMPHDRPFTTMADFGMCRRCRAEYDDPTNRRHHAQTIACRACGPRLSFESAEAEAGPNPAEGDDTIAAAQLMIAGGGVVAVKGVGGYHLAVDAENAPAVARLRRRKHRPHKPLAVMVGDLASARRIALLDAAEEAALTAPARPVVLAKVRPDAGLADVVAPGSPLVGVMLPSSPLHHLLFRPVPGTDAVIPRVLVMTSGNLSGEPICHDDEDARARLAAIADGYLGHDRRIHTPCDDSVARVIGGTVMPIRRSRGAAPLPVELPFSVPATLAVGGDIKNVICLAQGRRGWMSQHIGDIEMLASVETLGRSVELLGRLLATEPRRVVTDRHPAYRTRRWARAHVARDADAEVVEVDHHHAHAAALMAEHGFTRDRSLLTFVFDGSGLGPDDTLWGGEVILARYDGFERLGHLRPVPLTGGHDAVVNPCRVALAHLRAAGIAWDDDIPAVAACAAIERDAIAAQFEGAPRTSSMGRLFDAVASILDVRHRIGYEAHAAIELEFCAAGAHGPRPRLRFERSSGGELDPGPLLVDLVAAQRAGVDRSLLAAAFHDAVVAAMVELTRSVLPRPGLVGLTGGVFQNAYLVEGARRALAHDGYGVLVHERVPPNDGGLALGQVMVAAARERTEAGSCV